MLSSKKIDKSYLKDYLTNFVYEEKTNNKTRLEYLNIKEKEYPKFINEFWTSKQRQANRLHEIAYRACFKPQLPRFFINLLTRPGDVVYDPFSGRGTTAIEAALLNRNILANDINPLSKILAYPRLLIPDMQELKKRLNEIYFDENIRADIDLSMFYNPKTEAEIVSIKNYLKSKENNEDELDCWIRMLATNRLTGHSSGFFSVYTLPPNQAVTPESQIKINKKRNQIPQYRNTREIILKKTRNLIKDINKNQASQIKEIAKSAVFISEDARYTNIIKDNTIQLTVTSPPFLDVVQYKSDNWLRCWFNSIDPSLIAKRITMCKKIEDWCNVMGDVFNELFRITKPGGYVAFEVGEVKKGKINLEEHIIPLGEKANFTCVGIMINQQEFTKTSNIWGINNNKRGTNTNRIVIFKK